MAEEMAFKDGKVVVKEIHTLEAEARSHEAAHNPDKARELRAGLPKAEAKAEVKAEE